jgi:hypothetical protein
MKFRLLLPLLFLASLLSARAADLAGKWTAEFDTQIGVQKYTYEFRHDGDQLTGQAAFDHAFGKGTVQLHDIKVDGDKVSFKEPFNAQGMELTITYSGTLAGDELKLTRQVGDFATEQLTAKRAPAAK